MQSQPISARPDELPTRRDEAALHGDVQAYITLRVICSLLLLFLAPASWVAARLVELDGWHFKGIGIVLLLCSAFAAGVLALLLLLWTRFPIDVTLDDSIRELCEHRCLGVSLVFGLLLFFYSASPLLGIVFVGTHQVAVVAYLLWTATDSRRLAESSVEHGVNPPAAIEEQIAKIHDLIRFTYFVGSTLHRMSRLPTSVLVACLLLEAPLQTAILSHFARDWHLGDPPLPRWQGVILFVVVLLPPIVLGETLCGRSKLPKLHIAFFLVWFADTMTILALVLVGDLSGVAGAFALFGYYAAICVAVGYCIHRWPHTDQPAFLAEAATYYVGDMECRPPGVGCYRLVACFGALWPDHQDFMRNLFWHWVRDAYDRVPSSPTESHSKQLQLRRIVTLTAWLLRYAVQPIIDPARQFIYKLIIKSRH